MRLIVIRLSRIGSVIRNALKQNNISNAKTNIQRPSGNAGVEP